MWNFHAMRFSAVIVSILIGILNAPKNLCAAETDTMLDRQKVEAFVKEFQLWTDPDLFQRKEFQVEAKKHKDQMGFELGELKKILSDKCKVSSTVDGEKSEMSSDEFIKGLGKLRFMTVVRQFSLSEPHYDYQKEYTSVSMTVIWHIQNDNQALETKLRIRRENGRLAVTEVNNVFRKPTAQEMTSVEALIKREPYNPERGLGARYLGGGNFYGGAMSVSSDGKKLLYTSLQHESSELYLMNIDGSNATRLTNTPYWEIAPVFSPDDHQVFYLTDQEHPEGDVHVMNIDGSNAHRWIPDRAGITQPKYTQPKFSPDGKKAAFVGEGEQGTELFIANIDGSGTKQLTKTGNTCSAPNFFSDGQRIVFVQKWYDQKSDPPMRVGLFTVNVDGSDLKELFHESNRITLVGISKGKEPKIMFAKMDEKYENHLWTSDLDGKNQEKVRDGNIPDGWLSLDGKWFVYLAADDFAYDLYAMPVDGNAPTQRLTQEKGYLDCIAISPDSKNVYFLAEPKGAPDRGKGRICSVPIGGGKVITIGNNF